MPMSASTHVGSRLEEDALAQQSITEVGTEARNGWPVSSM
jgi:hypothetical protein